MLEAVRGVLAIRVLMTAVIVVAMIVMVIVIVIMHVSVRVFMLVPDLEELRLDFEDAVEVECVAAEHLRDRNRAFHGLVESGVGVDGADARLHLVQLSCADEIRFVEDDDVGEGDLAFGFRRVPQAIDEPFGVGDGDHGVEAGGVRYVRVDEKGLRHGGRVGKSGRLDDDGVELALALY